MSLSAVQNFWEGIYCFVSLEQCNIPLFCHEQIESETVGHFEPDFSCDAGKIGKAQESARGAQETRGEDACSHQQNVEGLWWCYWHKGQGETDQTLKALDKSILAAIDDDETMEAEIDELEEFHWQIMMMPWSSYKDVKMLRVKWFRIKETKVGPLQLLLVMPGCPSWTREDSPAILRDSVTILLGFILLSRPHNFLTH